MKRRNQRIYFTQLATCLSATLLVMGETFAHGADNGTAFAGVPWRAAIDRGREVPFSAIRLRKPHTDSAQVWKAMFAQFAKYRAGVDEVWFSTGITYPRMSEHRASAGRIAAAADDLRRIGILPSLQIQCTLGHSEAFARFGDNSGLAWQTYVASDGAVSKVQSCPRAPGLVAYMCEMSAEYARKIRPYSVWIDDDIRIVNHYADTGMWAAGSSGWGCHCARCLGLFAEKEGRKRTRAELVEAMKSDPGLESRWRAFAFNGAAALARAIGDAVHAVSPETRMCQQQPGLCFPEHRALYEAYHAATGLPIGMRPGAGSYMDYDARDQIDKAYKLALQVDVIGPLPFIDRICSETETYPHTFSCRTGRGVLLEALECLSQGMNAISANFLDSYESPEWYGDALLAPLARNADALKRYVAASEGAERAGYGVAMATSADTPPKELLAASLPLKPILSDARPQLARIVCRDFAVHVVRKGGDAVRRLLDDDLLLDGEAAEAICSAGFGAEIGLAGCRRFVGSIRERIIDDAFSKGLVARETPVAGKTYFLQPVDGAMAVGEYFSDANTHPSFGISSVAFAAPSGRRRVVFGHSAFTSSMVWCSGSRLVQLHRLADWASHGKSPVLVETPVRSFVQPRVRPDGVLATLVFVNASIDTTPPVRLRMRGVPKSATKAVWTLIDTTEIALSIIRDGDDSLVVLPPVPAWSGGWLAFSGLPPNLK